MDDPLAYISLKSLNRAQGIDRPELASVVVALESAAIRYGLQSEFQSAWSEPGTGHIDEERRRGEDRNDRSPAPIATSVMPNTTRVAAIAPIAHQARCRMAVMRPPRRPALRSR